MDVLRHIAPAAEEEDMPKQRHEEDRGRKVSIGTGSGERIGTGGVSGEMGRETYERGRGEGIEESCMGNQGMGEKGNGRGQRKLILHFDIRNTILVADSVTRVKVEQALNTFLTGVTWGRVGGDGDWEWLSDSPSLGPPCEGAITYYKHLERTLTLADSPDDRALLRQATGDFTRDRLGSKFRPHFEKHLRLLRWKHDDVPDKKLTMVGSDNCHYHYLLPSFIHLLYQLQAEGRDFAVVLRTYGMDASNVLSCLQYITTGCHPDFLGRRLPIDVRTNPGRVRRREHGRVEFRVVGEGCGTPEAAETGEVYNDELRIYDMLSGSRGITGFVDDFVYWQRNGYSHLAGKPFWIDLEDDAVQHIFFDDNIRVTADDSIVDVRLARPDGSGAFESIDLNRMSEFENACLVQADLLESIENVQYFIEKVTACERKYRRLTDHRKGRSVTVVGGEDKP